MTKGKGEVVVKDGGIHVTYPRRAHNPILRAVAWHRLPQKIPWLNDAPINFHFSQNDHLVLSEYDG